MEGRHFLTSEAKRHTVADLIDRYIADILPHKSPSTLYMQTLQLQWWRRQLATRRRSDTDVVFPGSQRHSSMRAAWEHAIRRAGIADCRFHDLRHSAASYLVMSGASLLDIATILGHKTLAIVKRYAHLSDSHTRNVVAKMNAAVFGE